MGGFGSGGGRGAPREEQFLKLDASRLKALGFLDGPCALQGFLWKRNEQERASIGIEHHGDHLELVYNWRPRGEEAWRLMREPVGLSFTTPQFGGRRIWLICPACDRRKRTLWGGKRFLCAACIGMRHDSQYESKLDRLMDKLWKGRKRLGGEAGLGWSFPPKPKRMRRTTYERLKAEDEALEMRIDAAAREKFGCGLDELI